MPQARKFLQFGAHLILLVLNIQEAAAKTWVQEDCGTSFVSEDGAFFYLNGMTQKRCIIESWPLDSTTAVLDCDDGTKLPVNFPPYGGDWLEINGVRLVEVADDFVCD